MIPERITDCHYSLKTERDPLKRLKRACVEMLLQPVQALKCSGAGGAEQNRGGALPPHPRAPTVERQPEGSKKRPRGGRFSAPVIAVPPLWQW